jgi:CRP-like cAMP-binding protein
MRIRKDTVILERRFAAKDSLLMEEGEFGAQAFLIQSGSVRVFTKNEGLEVELARLGVGEIFGEMAMIFDGPRTASVQAIEDCQLIAISRLQFLDKLNESEALIRGIVMMLTRRIVDVNNSLINKKSDVGDLKDAVQTIYQNVAFSLPGAEKVSFQRKVLPKLEAFMEELEGFIKPE